MKYEDMIKKEISNYQEITEVHELPSSYHYVSNKYITKLLEDELGVKNFEDLLFKQIVEIKKIKKEEQIHILSLGSGNCDFELNFAKDRDIKCIFHCFEISPFMLKRGDERARKLNLSTHFNFIESDVNKLNLDRKYDIIAVNHALHHFVELEHIFKEISNSMEDHSVFVTNDMIGRNGHMFWEPTLDLTNRIWAILPKELKYNHQHKKYYPERIQWDCSNDDLEGIRAQDILPLLDQHFNFTVFGTFFSLVNRFIDRDFGPNFDPSNKLHTSILDMIWELDDFCLRNKILKPTQMIAAMVKKNVKVENKKFTYFEDPKEAYKIDDTRFYDLFTL